MFAKLWHPELLDTLTSKAIQKHSTRQHASERADTRTETTQASNLLPSLKGCRGRPRRRREPANERVFVPRRVSHPSWSDTVSDALCRDSRLGDGAKAARALHVSQQDKVVH